MKVTFLGTGVSIPYENRAQSSILIESDLKILVDVGIGAFLRLEQLKVSLCEIDAILITHHHLDHNGDLLNILKARWLMGFDELKIYGPAGTKCFMESLLNSFPYLRGKIKFRAYEEENFKIGDLKIKAVKTFHSIESQGYLIDDLLAISGDTRAFKEFMSLDCSFMIHELSLPFNYRPEFHTTPENLKEFLKFLKADKLFLTHLYPVTHEIKEEIIEFLEIDVEIAKDFQNFSLK
ncbi:MAG: MBL fold metallo-hydrolase [Archaeoglobaceae archaeon]|nr:MBL fold metallo-hydrolase [Archaeoglobaceae archaeon]